VTHCVDSAHDHVFTGRFLAGDDSGASVADGYANPTGGFVASLSASMGSAGRSEQPPRTTPCGLLDLGGLESPADVVIAGSMDVVVAGMAEYVAAGATELRVGIVPSVAEQTKAALADWLL